MLALSIKDILVEVHVHTIFTVLGIGELMNDHLVEAGGLSTRFLVGLAVSRD